MIGIHTSTIQQHLQHLHVNIPNLFTQTFHRTADKFFILKKYSHISVFKYITVLYITVHYCNSSGQCGVIVAMIVSLIPCLCHRWHGCHRGSMYVMVRWGRHILHTVPYCAIVLHQNRPFPAPGQCGVIVAMIVSLTPCLCHRWHGCHRGVMGDIACTSWWGGYDIYYILCHIVPLFYTYFPARTVWCHCCHDGVIDSMSVS